MLRSHQRSQDHRRVLTRRRWARPEHASLRLICDAKECDRLVFGLHIVHCEDFVRLARLSRFRLRAARRLGSLWLRALTATVAARAGRRARALHEQVRDPQHEHHGVGVVPSGSCASTCCRRNPRTRTSPVTAPVGSTRCQRRPPARSRCTGCPASPRDQRRFQNPSPRATWRTVPAGSAAVISPLCVASTHGALPMSRLRALPQQRPTHGRDDRTVDRDRAGPPLPAQLRVHDASVHQCLRAPLVRRVTSSS